MIAIGALAYPSALLYPVVFGLFMVALVFVGPELARRMPVDSGLVAPTDPVAEGPVTSATEGNRGQFLSPHPVGKCLDASTGTRFTYRPSIWAAALLATVFTAAAVPSGVALLPLLLAMVLLAQLDLWTYQISLVLAGLAAIALALGALTTEAQPLVVLGLWAVLTGLFAVASLVAASGIGDIFVAPTFLAAPLLTTDGVTAAIERATVAYLLVALVLLTLRFRSRSRGTQFHVPLITVLFAPTFAALFGGAFL